MRKKTNLKSDVNKLDFDKLKNIPCGLSSCLNKGEKLDIGKLETAPIEMSKLTNVVKYDVLKKSEYNKLVQRVIIINTADTSNLV